MQPGGSTPQGTPAAQMWGLLALHPDSYTIGVPVMAWNS